MLAGTGNLGMPVYALARLIASSQTWQTWTAQPNEGAAINFVHFPQASDREEDRAPRPRAVISWCYNEFSIKAVAQRELYGALELSIEALPDSQYADVPSDACMYFANQVGSVQLDMLTNSGAAPASGSGYLNLTYMHLLQGPSPSIPDNEPDGVEFFGVTFLCGFKG